MDKCARWAVGLGLVFLVVGCAPPDHDRVLGEPCGCNGECLPELYCGDSAGHDIPAEEAVVGTTCEGHGTCVTRRSAGQACDYDTPCATGLRCLEREPRTCEPPQLAGAACGDPRDCGAGLVCNVALVPAQCAVPGSDGDACGGDADCAAGLDCNQGTVPALCEPLHAHAVGEACSTDEHCAGDLLCHTTGHCVAAGETGALYYDGPSTCTAPGSVAPGAWCARDAECASGRCDMPATGVCRQGTCAP